MFGLAGSYVTKYYKEQNLGEETFHFWLGFEEVYSNEIFLNMKFVKVYS